MTRDQMNILMKGLTLGEMRRTSRSIKGADEWDGCWPILRPLGRTWVVSVVYDSDDIERVGPYLVPVEIVGTGASLRIRRCDPDQGCDAYVYRSIAEYRLQADEGGGA